VGCFCLFMGLFITLAQCVFMIVRLCVSANVSFICCFCLQWLYIYVCETDLLYLAVDLSSRREVHTSNVLLIVPYVCPV
jgi:hypothetical protein